MPSMITPRFLDSSFNYGTNPKHASESIHRDLKTISEATFLKVNESGKIVKISFIEWIWENLKGVAGFIDHTRKEIVRLRVKQLLVYSAENGYISKEDFIGPESLINNLAKNMGLTPSEPNKIQDLEEFDELIHAIAAKTFHPESKEPNYQEWISKYRSRHIRDFEPHSIITRIWLDCFDSLTLDEELAESEFPFQNSNFSSQLVKTNVQQTPPPPDVPVVVMPIPSAVTKKSTSWTKRIGLTLLGAGAITGAYYAGQEYLKQYKIHPIPEPDSGYGNSYSIMGVCSAIIIAVGLMYCGKKKLHKYLKNAFQHANSSSSGSSPTSSKKTGDSRSMFGSASSPGSSFKRSTAGDASRNSLGTQSRSNFSKVDPGLPVVPSDSGINYIEKDDDENDLGNPDASNRSASPYGDDEDDLDLDNIRRESIRQFVQEVKNKSNPSQVEQGADEFTELDGGWVKLPKPKPNQPVGAQASSQISDKANINPKDPHALKKTGSPINLTNSDGSPKIVRIRVDMANTPVAQTAEKQTPESLTTIE